MTAEPLLSVSEIHVHYGAIHALHGVSVEVHPKEIVALIGANGAGKSSTLRAISGMIGISSGSARFRGAEVANRKAHELVPMGMAHAPEGRGIFLNLSVDENLSMGAFLRKDKDAVERDRERSFAFFPRLRERRQQVAGTLSGGEQQMLAIARAMMSRPTLLLLDEPSLGLAPQIVEQIFEILRAVNEEEGTAILLVEQNAAKALELAHRAYVLETGVVSIQGTGAELLASPAVRRAYLGE